MYYYKIRSTLEAHLISVLLGRKAVQDRSCNMVFGRIKRYVFDLKLNRTQNNYLKTG